MPDIDSAVRSLAVAMPNLLEAFWRGGQYAIGAFVLIGIIYFLRRYL
jgi:hypothetical protein